MSVKEMHLPVDKNVSAGAASRIEFGIMRIYFDLHIVQVKYTGYMKLLVSEILEVESLRT
jgi:hypothetical protein